MILNLKLSIVSAYERYVRKLQKGHPFVAYEPIKEAIFALECVLNNPLTDAEKIKIINFHLLNLNEGGK